MDRDACLLVNPAAGGGKAARVLPDVEAELRRLGVAFRTEQTTSLLHATELARAAAERGEAIVTLSGDGLIGSVVGTLKQVDGALLGVLPGGRGNDLARVLGIPLEAVPACEVIATGTPRALDIGEVEGRSFIGIASLGFDSVANKIANEAPSRLGNLVYAYGALRALAAWRPATFTVDFDGASSRTFTGWSVGACNSKAYGGGMYAAPDAELDDGLLDVVVCETTSKRTFMTRILPGLFRGGTHMNLPQVHCMRAREVRIASDRPFALYADGDPVGDLPITVRIRPGALTALVP